MCIYIETGDSVMTRVKTSKTFLKKKLLNVKRLRKIRCLRVPPLSLLLYRGARTLLRGFGFFFLKNRNLKKKKNKIYPKLIYCAGVYFGTRIFEKRRFAPRFARCLDTIAKRDDIAISIYDRGKKKEENRTRVASPRPALQRQTKMVHRRMKKRGENDI